ncbi:MAG TPA: PAS domain S-box protein, partial [Armatimonadota bacterium]|nr:PAS domain S-box protein [Armatimonadota bacterium]
MTKKRVVIEWITQTLRNLARPWVLPEQYELPRVVSEAGNATITSNTPIRCGANHFDNALNRHNSGPTQDNSLTNETQERLQRTNRALKMLSTANEALIRATDETTLLQQICRVAVEVGGYRLAWVGFLEHDPQKTVHPVAEAGHEEGYLKKLRVTWDDTPHGRGPVGTAIRTGKTVVVRNILTDPAFAPWRKDAQKRGYASVIGLPLYANDQVFGAFTLYAEMGDAFDGDEVSLLEELAGDLAFGINTLRLQAERKLSEQALRESERRLATLISNLPGMAYRCRNERGWTMEFISEGCYELTGYRSVDLQENRACSYADLIHPEDRGYVWQEVQTAIQENRAFEIIYRIHHAAGSVRWVWERGRQVPSFRNHNATLEGFITDITALKDAEDALRAEKERAQTYLNTASVLMVVLDAEQRVTLINQKGSEVLGYPSEEIVGHNWFDTFVPPHDRERIRAAFSQLLTGDIIPVQYCENGVLTRNGQERLVAWHNAVLRDSSGRIIGALCSGEDITERRQAEAATQAAQEQLLRAEMEKKQFTQEIIRVMTHGKLRLVDQDAIPTEGTPALDIHLEDAASYRSLRKQLETAAGAAGMSEDAAAGFVLAVCEAATNAIKHAVRGRFTLHITEDRLIARVSEAGKGI